MACSWDQNLTAPFQALQNPVRARVLCVEGFSQGFAFAEKEKEEAAPSQENDLAARLAALR